MEYNSEHLSKLWILYLKEKGVKLPKDGKLREGLNYLFQNMGTYKHIDEIKTYVAQKFTLTGTDPLQIRHLSTQFGWNIVKKGRYEHCLVDVFEPSPSFIPDRRGDDLSAAAVATAGAALSPTRTPLSTAETPLSTAAGAGLFTVSASAIVA
mgnify:CR=1 FL=1